MTARHLGRLFVVAVLGLTVPLEVWAQPRKRKARPTLVRVTRTADGYVLEGTRFGKNASAIRVFEGTRQVPAAAIAVVQDTRIVVRRPVSGTIRHRVLVGRLASGILTVTHPAANPPTVIPCPSAGGPPCSNNGTCNSSTGQCACNAGFGGPACQFSDAITCNRNGTVDGSGKCKCKLGFEGNYCDRCAPNYYAYPQCRYCHGASTCSGHGICTTTGLCQCAQGFTGADCATSAP